MPVYLEPKIQDLLFPDLHPPSLSVWRNGDHFRICTKKEAQENVHEDLLVRRLDHVGSFFVQDLHREEFKD